MPGRPREFDALEVLTRAMFLFWKKGYAGTGMAELEQATGLKRQSLYGAFGDKRALFEKVVEHYTETVLKPGIQRPLEAPGSPRENIERWIRSWEAVAAAPEFNGCLVGNCIAELSARDAEVAGLLAPRLALMERWLRTALTRAKRAGELPSELDSRDAARTLLSLMQGLGIVARVSRDSGFARSVVGSALALLGARS